MFLTVVCVCLSNFYLVFLVNAVHYEGLRRNEFSKIKDRTIVHHKLYKHDGIVKNWRRLKYFNDFENFGEL